MSDRSPAQRRSAAARNGAVPSSNEKDETPQQTPNAETQGSADQGQGAPLATVMADVQLASGQSSPSLSDWSPPSIAAIQRRLALLDPKIFRLLIIGNVTNMSIDLFGPRGYFAWTTTHIPCDSEKKPLTVRIVNNLGTLTLDCNSGFRVGGPLNIEIVNNFGEISIDGGSTQMESRCGYTGVYSASNMGTIRINPPLSTRGRLEGVVLEQRIDNMGMIANKTVDEPRGLNLESWPLLL
ncbi:MAG: hypothetical protein M4579_000830 [Chaenotheca gracillima]|nr:MAG: hypothetical protein M4579_000830 [Chaenotheca gracillima]